MDHHHPRPRSGDPPFGSAWDGGREDPERGSISQGDPGQEARSLLQWSVCVRAWLSLAGEHLVMDVGSREATSKL
jgi:hypothetical protein